MKNCWEIRGCPKEMEKRCPFYENDAPCTFGCRFTFCVPKKYQPSLGELSFDRKSKGLQATKERCFSCQVFIDALEDIG